MPLSPGFSICQRGLAPPPHKAIMGSTETTLPPTPACWLSPPLPSPVSWERGEERACWVGSRVCSAGEGLFWAFPSRPPAQVCKRPLTWGTPAPPPSRPYPPPQPYAALAAAEPGLIATILAPSKQDQCLGRKCAEPYVYPPPTFHYYCCPPWDLGGQGL